MYVLDIKYLKHNVPVIKLCLSQRDSRRCPRYLHPLPCPSCHWKWV